MFLSSRFTLLAAVAAAVGLGLVPVTNANAGLVFEADFSGPGAGTGPGNIVQSGGTATIVNPGANATASVVPGINLAGGPGGYLNINETAAGANGTGAALVPTSPANGITSWWSPTGSGTGAADNTINGSFDYFYKVNQASSSWGNGTSQPIWNVPGQFGINLNSQPNGYQFWVHGTNGTGSYIAASNYTGQNGGFTNPMLAGTLLHVAGVVSTNSTSGLVTADLYVVPNNVAITPGTTPVFATATSTAPFTATGNANTNFTFGDDAFNPPLAQTEQFDQFRIYSGTLPTGFSFSALPTAIPEPATLGLMAVLGAGLLLVGRKRKVA